MKKINLNDVAQEITLHEGGKVSISIAQVKEVLRVLFTGYELVSIVAMWFKFNKE